MARSKKHIMLLVALKWFEKKSPTKKPKVIKYVAHYENDYTFRSNSAQVSALKVAYIFKVFGAQSCLMIV